MRKCSRHENKFQLLQVKVRAVSHAIVAIVILTVHTEIGHIFSLGNSSTLYTFHCLSVLLCNHHILLLVFPCCLEFIQTIQFSTWTKLFPLSRIHHHFPSHILNYFYVTRFKLLQIEVLQALMVSKFTSFEFLGTNLALNHDFRAFTLYVISQLPSRQVLVLLHIANITSKLWTFIILNMILKFIDSFPSDLGIRASFLAPMREFTKLNYIA